MGGGGAVLVLGMAADRRFSDFFARSNLLLMSVFSIIIVWPLSDMRWLCVQVQRPPNPE